MRCLGCQYDLKKLAENRCPECGRAFDPNDASSFESGNREFPFPTVVFCLLLIFVFVGFMLLALIPIEGDWPLIAQVFRSAIYAIAPCSFVAPLVLAVCLGIGFWRARARR